MTIGFLLALCSAVGVSWHGQTVQIVKENVPTTILLAIKSLIASICVLSLLFILGEAILPTQSQFWYMVAGMVAIEFAIDFSFTRSHQLGDQSQVGPLMGSTPMFLLPVGILFLGDTFHWVEMLGVILISVGVVVANWKEGGDSFVGAIRAIMNSEGARWMLLFGFLAVIAITYAKYNFNEGIPVLQFAFWVLLGQCFVAVVLAGIRGEWKQPRSASLLQIVHVGVSFGFVQIAHFLGLSMLPAAFLAAIKRLSIIFDVFVGRIFGKEVTFFGSRLRGAIIIFSGVAMFTLYSVL